MTPDSSPSLPESAPRAVLANASPACTAFAIGWQVGALASDASLYADAAIEGERPHSELTALPPVSEIKRALDQIRGGLYKLAGHLQAAGFEPISSEELEEILQDRVGDPETRQQGLTDFDRQVSSGLTAADGRLGKGYDLGRALAQTCFEPEDEDSFDRAFGPRIVDIKNWLADLASSFPPHASRGVVLSLRTWEAWAADPILDNERLDWKRDGPAVRTALRRQGEIWRALLAAEKDGAEMLDTPHYLRAANRLVAGMASSVWRFVRPLALPLAILVLLLGSGIALLVIAPEGGQIVGAIATALGAVGITGAGLRARLSRATSELETHIWGAELDLAIAEAVLIGPEGWNARRIEVPAIGPVPKAASNLEIVRNFRDLLRDATRLWQRRRIAALLAPDAEFIDASGESRTGRESIANWLIRDPAAAKQIADNPRRLVAGRPGMLVSEFDDQADVWWVREGKIRYWQRFSNQASARARAGLPPKETTSAHRTTRSNPA